MKALILGNVIVELHAEEFPVAEPLFWADVPNDTSLQDTWSGVQVIKYVEPVMSAQEIRKPATDAILRLQREMVLAEIAADLPATHRIRREISRIKFMSAGV